MEDLMREFLVESYENLDRLDQEFVRLEKDPASRELISSIFRTIHTIKGTCGFLALDKLGALAHTAENLLSKMRDGKIRLNPDIATVLLASVDAIREMLGSIEKTGAEGGGDYSTLIDQLTHLLDETSPVAPAEASAPAITPEKAAPAAAKTSAPAASLTKAAAKTSASKPSPAKAAAAAKTGAPAAALAKEAAAPVAPTAPAATPAKAEPAPVEASVPAVPSAKPAAAPVEAATAAKPAAGGDSSDLASSAIRVDVGLLDRLMNMVGELVLARNQILLCNARSEDLVFGAASQRLNLLTTELQEIAMKTRLQPIGNIWSKLPRVVRDVARDLGKKVDLLMEGGETELDRNVIETIKDPLTHILRNSCDHGIESPAKRLAAGKPELSQLKLRAFHGDGQVNIELQDDGAGIDPEKVRHRAVERGLISHEDAARCTEKELIQFLFAPGFSTAEKITSVSGRGVGMDVVKTNVEKIGGTVELTSVLGAGTTVRIRIPLTLAIIPALIVGVGGERYAIPQAGLIELVRFVPEQKEEAMEQIHGASFLRLRGRLLPLLDLRAQLDVDPTSTRNETLHVVVVQAGGDSFGLMVDAIHDSAEIVVKPLDKHFRTLTCFAGATIMGDGQVALILDIAGLAQHAQLKPQSTRQAVIEAALTGDKNRALQTLLVFRAGERHRMAMPLSTVARLEQFKSSAIERSGRHEVIQYRGEIVPVVRISTALGLDHIDESELCDAVVYHEAGGRSVVLIVGHIDDIIESNCTLQTEGARRGVLGSAIIQERVTDWLDIPTLIRDAAPEYFQTAA